MFFEDEKDIIESGADIQISEDGTVTWEDVLNDTDENIVSVKNVPPVKNEPKKESTIDLGDELELVSDIDEDINEADLAQILNETPSPKQKAFDSFGTSEKDSTEENSEDSDFDIDEQLANVALEENGQKNDEEEIVLPRKNERKSSPSLMVFLLAILFAVVVVAGVYYILEYTKENNLNQNEIQTPQSVQQEMNNITPEEIAQRKEDTIPVVNENEVGEIKPDEQQPPEEKKEVIDIKPTGRANPFMPLQKYIAVEIPETVIQYDKTGLPKPPESYGLKDEKTVKMLAIAVSGIMYDDTNPSAIITFDNNDYFVQKGDRLDDYRVVDIARNSVTIALGKNLYKANIGEEFKISSSFYGSAQYLSPKQGGGRQYHAVSNEQNDVQQPTRNVIPANRYVSEEDVIINSK